MGLLSLTKGELAGFGEGLREDRLRREDREEKSRLLAEQRAYDKEVREQAQKDQIELLKTRFGLEQQEAEKLRQQTIERGVNAVYSALGSKLPASARANVYNLLDGGAYTADSFVEAWSSGKIKWNESTKNARYSLGSMEEMSAYWTQLEQEYDLPTGFLATTASIESSLGKKMSTGLSSAKGLFAFTDGTAEEYGVDVYDWKSSSLGAAKYAANNKKRLQERLNTTDITGAQLYLAHQQGAGGAMSLLSRPTAMAIDVVGAKAVNNNVSDSEKAATFTAQQFSDLWVNKYESHRKQVEQYVNTPLMAGPVAIADRGVDVEEPTGKYGFEVVSETTTKTPYEYLENLNSVNEIIGRMTMVENDPDIKPSVRAFLIGELRETMGEMNAEAEKNAAKNREFSTYLKLNSDGVTLLTPHRLRRTPDGNLEDETGKEVQGNYVHVAGDLEAFQKYHNAPIRELTEMMANSANLARDIVDLRQLILGNEEVLNRFSAKASDLNAFLSEGKSFVDKLWAQMGGGSGAKYTYEEILNLSLGADLTQLEQLKLRIGYGLARLEGSSGQALSNRELEMNLNSFLSKGDPANSIDVLNKLLRTLEAKAETNRNTATKSMFNVEIAEKVYAQASWNTPMEKYIPQQLGELAKDYAAAKEGVNPLREPTEGKVDENGEPEVITQDAVVQPLTEEQINQKIAAYQQSQAFVSDKESAEKVKQLPIAEKRTWLRIKAKTIFGYYDENNPTMMGLLATVYGLE